MSDLDRWLEQAGPALDIEQDVLDRVTGPILDMVRDVAHHAVRPGAPLTAFLVGLAAGRVLDDGSDVDAIESEVLARLEVVDGLVSEWVPPVDDQPAHTAGDVAEREAPSDGA
ncbi:DUF6457 domain-containing protein [Sanguibacter sp. HDW7]|uniref:DUF6457 domain-containing protein n=1 Tax=Sanguibacter sp. HDW7 TaxID=2714931 RepID=UPI00197F1EAE|nr:DUF6457 domain-containing protein [Sanguibacter sp. HDW7]